MRLFPLAALLLALVLPNLAQAQSPPNCGDPCRITYNNGGIVKDFVRFAVVFRHTKRLMIIDGFCASSCMVMADLARPRVCITPRAAFGYHRTNYGRPIPLRRDLDTWIRWFGGGYPPFYSVSMMPNSVAGRFWPRCKGGT